MSNKHLSVTNLRQGVFLSVVRLGVLIKPRILRRNDEEVSKLR